jgi:hypothetical protein
MHLHVPTKTRLSLLHRSAVDRLIPVLLIVAALWVAVGWATDQW